MPALEAGTALRCGAASPGALTSTGAPLTRTPLRPLPRRSYDSSTTVSEAVEGLAHSMKLENYQTFSLFAVHKVGGSGWVGAGPGQGRGA